MIEKHEFVLLMVSQFLVGGLSGFLLRGVVMKEKRT